MPSPFLCVMLFNGKHVPKDEKRYPMTPDGRYFVVRGRLWRCSDPGLDAEVRGEWVRALCGRGAMWGWRAAPGTRRR